MRATRPVPLSPPHALVRVAGALLPGVVFHVRTSARAIALTLDDGPDPALTPRILETLERHGARATFFLLGERAGAAEQVVAQIVAAGHEVGNHTWLDEPTALLRRGELRRSLLATHEILERHAPGRVRVFRPGSGWFTPAVLRAARALAYNCVLASIYPNDLRVRDEERIVRDVFRHVRPGAILVLHEGRGRERVVSILERVLGPLRADGWSIVTVAELQAMAVGG